MEWMDEERKRGTWRGREGGREGERRAIDGRREGGRKERGREEGNRWKERGREEGEREGEGQSMEGEREGGGWMDGTINISMYQCINVRRMEAGAPVMGADRRPSAVSAVVPPSPMHADR